MSAKEKQAFELEKQQKEFCVEIGGAIGKIRRKYDIADYEIAKRSGFPQSTFSVKMKNPGKLSIEEFFRLSKQFPEIRESLIKAL
jgi:hypothetical protein